MTQETGLLEKTAETAQEATASPENIKETPLPKRLRAAQIVVLAAVLVGGAAWCTLSSSEWSVLLFPLLGGVAVAFVWAVVQVLFFAHTPQRYHKQFKRPVYYASLLPLWCLCTFGLFALPVNITNWNEPLVDALIALMIAILFFAAPVFAAVFGILAITFGVKHLKMTEKDAGALYRKGPLVVASILCAVVVGICVFGVFVLL